MYQAIVVGTDGSETANIAVGRATELAKLTGATLHIVHAFQPLTRTHLGASATVASPTIDIVQVNEGIEGARARSPRSRGGGREAGRRQGRGPRAPR